MLFCQGSISPKRGFLLYVSLLTFSAECIIIGVESIDLKKGSVIMAKKKMKNSTRNVFKILISIIYIIWGIYAPVQAFQAVIALNVGAIISAAVGILTLLAGIFGLFGLKKEKCRIFGIIIFLFSLIGAVVALPTINVSSIITAILAWLFIICL